MSHILNEKILKKNISQRFPSRRPLTPNAAELTGGATHTCGGDGKVYVFGFPASVVGAAKANDI